MTQFDPTAPQRPSASVQYVSGPRGKEGAPGPTGPPGDPTTTWTDLHVLGHSGAAGEGIENAYGDDGYWMAQKYSWPYKLAQLLGVEHPDNPRFLPDGNGRNLAKTGAMASGGSARFGAGWVLQRIKPLEGAQTYNDVRSLALLFYGSADFYTLGLGAAQAKLVTGALLAIAGRLRAVKVYEDADTTATTYTGGGWTTEPMTSCNSGTGIRYSNVPGARIEMNLSVARADGWAGEPITVGLPIVDSSCSGTITWTVDGQTLRTTNLNGIGALAHPEGQADGSLPLVFAERFEGIPADASKIRGVFSQTAADAAWCHDYWSWEQEDTTIGFVTIPAHRPIARDPYDDQVDAASLAANLAALALVSKNAHQFDLEPGLMPNYGTASQAEDAQYFTGDDHLSLAGEGRAAGGIYQELVDLSKAFDVYTLAAAAGSLDRLGDGTDLYPNPPLTAATFRDAVDPGDAITVDAQGRPASLGPVVSEVNGVAAEDGSITLDAADVGAADAQAFAAEKSGRLVRVSDFFVGAVSATGAAMAAITAAGAGGIIDFDLPISLSTPLVPLTGQTWRGRKSKSLITSTTAMNSAIVNGTAPLADLAFEDLWFQGNVVDDGVFPRRGRTTSGPGFLTAISLLGDMLPSIASTAPVIRGVRMRNVRIARTPGLPILLKGIRGICRHDDCESYNTMDWGWVYCEEVALYNSRAYRSADNGFSISRGCQRVTAIGNRSRDCAYWGLWFAGFPDTGHPEDAAAGAQSIVATGNWQQNSGYGGICCDLAPQTGVIKGNICDGALRGPVDAPSDQWGVGLSIGTYPDTTTPTIYPQYLDIEGNVWKDCALGGARIAGLKHSRVRGNTTINPGSATNVAGTAVPSSDPNQNYGILFFSVDCDDVEVEGNRTVDTRATALANYAVYAGSRLVNGRVRGNKGYRCRQAKPVLVQQDGTSSVEWLQEPAERQSGSLNVVGTLGSLTTGGVTIYTRSAGVAYSPAFKGIPTSVFTPVGVTGAFAAVAGVPSNVSTLIQVASMRSDLPATVVNWVSEVA